METNDEEEIIRERYISLEQTQKIIDDLRLKIIKNNKNIINLLDNTTNEPSKFKTRNWAEINDESRGTYNESNQIKFKTSMIR